MHRGIACIRTLLTSVDINCPSPKHSQDPTHDLEGSSFLLQDLHASQQDLYDNVAAPEAPP